MDLKEFRDYFRVFTSTRDEELHEKVIVAMLDPLDLDIEYKKLRSEGGIERVLDIFASFADTADDELITDYEKKSLEQVGKLTEQYFAQKNYLAFAEMVLAMTLESLAEKYGVLPEEEMVDIDVELLYRHIPEEVYLQTFLLENMANKKTFDWERSEQIVEQSLIVLTVCFSDIYDFIAYDETVEEEFAG
jgi:hypothetical protein